MHIERTNNYQPRDVSGSAPDLTRAAPLAGDLGNASDAAAVTPDAGTQALANLAASAPEIREDAVAEAKRLLESGQLSSMEAIRRAAEAILDRGI